MAGSRALDAAVRAADADAEILSAVSAAVATVDGVPTLAELAAWFVEAAPELAKEANVRLVAVLGDGAEWVVARTVQVVFGADGIGRADDAESAEAVLKPCLPGSPGSLSAMHRAWRSMKVAPRHPLAPLVRGWLARAPEVVAETRSDKRILPRFDFSDFHPDRARGMLLGAGLGERPGAVQRVLPLWPEPARVKRVPLLELVDASGVPVFARGRGVPLGARLFVRTLVAVRPEDRARQQSRIAVTLRELRDALFPPRRGGDGRLRTGWRVSAHWPRLRAALKEARNYGIPDGRGGLWFAVAVRRMPEEPRNLDELVVIDVAFPPGSASGPVVDLPHLDELAVTSAPKWRAYIGASALVWIPGRTRVRHPRDGRWVWTRDRDAYPVLTAADRRRLAFGEVKRFQGRTRPADDAFRGLPGFVIDTERAVDPVTGEVGWRVVPERPQPEKSAG